MLEEIQILLQIQITSSSSLCSYTSNFLLYHTLFPSTNILYTTTFCHAVKSTRMSNGPQHTTGTNQATIAPITVSVPILPLTAQFRSTVKHGVSVQITSSVGRKVRRMWYN